MTQAGTSLVEPSALARSLGDPRLRVVDCRRLGDAGAERGAGHVPGAVHCGVAGDPSSPTGDLRSVLSSPEIFASAVTRLGIGNDTRVVAYDDEGGLHAARLWWGLRLHGHDDAALLHGGLRAWREAGLPLEDAEVTPPRAEFTLRLRGGLVASKDDILTVFGLPVPVLLDVRTRAEFTGEDVRCARGGRIPGAQHLDVRDLLDERERLRPDVVVRAMLAARRVEPDVPVILYSHEGGSAAFAAFVLHLLGATDVRVYTGSWLEWGNDPDLPATTGDPD